MQKKKNISGGGAQTNKNGIAFEDLTDLGKLIVGSDYTVNDCKEKRSHKQAGWEIYSSKGEKIGLIAKQHGFYRHFLKPNGVDWQKVISKQLKPDDCYFSFITGTLTIIEKKNSIWFRLS